MGGYGDLNHSLREANGLEIAVQKRCQLRFG